MEHILIPAKRAVSLAKICRKTGEILDCEIKVEGEEVMIHGNAYSEYSAKNVVQAFGRGFSMMHAYKLLDDEYFFKCIDLKDFLGSEAQIRRIKARVIGRNGKAKLYMERVSGAGISVYGNSVSMIGKSEELGIASVALQILIEGGTHKKAYRVMERLRRRVNKEAY